MREKKLRSKRFLMKKVPGTFLVRLAAWSSGRGVSVRQGCSCGAVGLHWAGDMCMLVQFHCQMGFRQKGAEGMEAEARAVVERLNKLAEEGADKEAIDKAWFDFRRIRPQPTDFSDAEFVGVDLSNQNLSKLILTGAKFAGCTLRGTNFTQSDLTLARFVGENFTQKTQIADSIFDNARCAEVRFENCDLEKANFFGTALSNSRFKGCFLAGTNFTSAFLRNAKFDKVEFNSATCFRHVLDAKDMTMSKYEFACLGPEAGQLTVGNQMDMNIVDDASKLRQEFGGVWAVLHLLGLFVFMGPYAWFLMYHWSLAQFSDDAGGMTLGTALGRFILTGGDNWQAGWGELSINWVSLLCFVTYLAYNLARAFLVWKTKRLETEQEVKGLPVKFSLERERKWNACYWFVRATLYFAVAAVAINSIIFLLVRLPPVAP